MLTTGGSENLDFKKNDIVSSTCNFLQQSTDQHIIAYDNLVFWHKNIPLKIELFVTPSEPLLTKDNCSREG